MPSTLHAGAATVEITPTDPKGHYLAGFGFNRLSESVRDPLYARAVALRNGETTLVLVALDLVGLMRDDVRRIREKAELGEGATLLVASTHTHAGPDTMGYWGPSIAGVFPYKTGKDSKYMEFLHERAAEAARRAVEALRPAKGAWFTVEIPPTGYHENIHPGAALDSTMRVLALRDEDGEPIATVTNWACHPEMLWERNTAISSDFAGRFCTELEAQVGGIAVFFNGALGGMVSGDLAMDLPDEERGPFIDWLGRRLAFRVSDALKNITNFETYDLGHSDTTFELTITNRRFLLARKLGIFRREGITDNRMTTECHLVRIGPGALVTMPGEVLPELAETLLDEIHSEFSGVISLGCDELGYLLPERFFTTREYRYEASMSPGPSAEKTLVEQAKTLQEKLPRL